MTVFAVLHLATISVDAADPTPSRTTCAEMEKAFDRLKKGQSSEAEFLSELEGLLSDSRKIRRLRIGGHYLLGNGYHLLPLGDKPAEGQPDWEIRQMRVPQHATTFKRPKVDCATIFKTKPIALEIPESFDDVSSLVIFTQGHLLIVGPGSYSVSPR